MSLDSNKYWDVICAVAKWASEQAYLSDSEIEAELTRVWGGRAVADVRILAARMAAERSARLAAEAKS